MKTDCQIVGYAYMCMVQRIVSDRHIIIIGLNDSKQMQFYDDDLIFICQEFPGASTTFEPKLVSPQSLGDRSGGTTDDAVFS